MNPRTMITLVAMVMLCGCGSVELAPAEERDAYLPHVALAEVRVGKTMNGRYQVYGQVHNNGDRPIAAVMIKIDWLDQTGAAIGSVTKNCVSGKLEPKTMQEFKIPAAEAPEAWDHKVDVTVADLGFGS